VGKRSSRVSGAETGEVEDGISKWWWELHE
jgi:hypothetical protein